jgi:hypothetical protein
MMALSIETCSAPVILRNVHLTSSESKNDLNMKAASRGNLEDGGRTFLQNISKLLLDCTSMAFLSNCQYNSNVFYFVVGVWTPKSLGAAPIATHSIHQTLHMDYSRININVNKIYI